MITVKTEDVMTVIVLETTALVTALSADAFAAGIAYGAGEIKLPPVSLLTASAVSSLILSFSILAGRLAGSALPGGIVKMLGFLLLAGIGIWKLFDRSVREEAKKADKNQDRSVSPAEALTLGAALSADSLAAGIGAGALRTPFFLAIGASFLAGAAALFFGEKLGGCLERSDSRRLDPVRLSGFLLLFLAFLKLL